MRMSEDVSSPITKGRRLWIFESGVSTGSCTGASPLDGSTVARGSLQEFVRIVGLFEDKGAAWVSATRRWLYLPVPLIRSFL